MEDIENSQLLVDEIYEKYFKEGEGDFYKYAFHLLNFRTLYNEFIIIRAPVNDAGKYEPLLKIVYKGLSIITMNFPVVDTFREAEEMLVIWADGYRNGFKENHHYFRGTIVESKNSEEIVRGRISKIYPKDQFMNGSFMIITDNVSGTFKFETGNRYIAPFGTFNVIKHV